MPSFNLPSSPPREAYELPQPAPAVPASMQPDHPPSHQSAAVNQSAAVKQPAAWEKVPAVINRLRASVARAEAVHRARMDQAFMGPERHLLVRYTSSAK